VGNSGFGRDAKADKTSTSPKKKRKQKAIGGPATGLFHNLFLLPGSLGICTGKEEVPAWVPSFMVAESLAASGTGINQQNMASNQSTLTSTALASKHQPENTLTIDPSLVSAEGRGHIRPVQLLNDRLEDQLYVTPPLHGAVISCHSPTIFTMESPKATAGVAQDDSPAPLRSPLAWLERSLLVTMQSTLPVRMSSLSYLALSQTATSSRYLATHHDQQTREDSENISPTSPFAAMVPSDCRSESRMFTSPSNTFPVNNISQRPSPFGPFHKDSLSVSKKPHQPTRISLSPVASFTLQLQPWGFSSQPLDLTPHSNFGHPSSPVHNHHVSDRILPTAAHA
jgi:hypothetical protein